MSRRNFTGQDAPLRPKNSEDAIQPCKIFCHLVGYERDVLGKMITNNTITATERTDAELVSCALAGDRDAFSRIVSRYQNLICSLAYSRIGNLGMSEDIAQETFITAWRRLRLLREPEKLRGWLCGIVRNRVHKSIEREGREPVTHAESLEAVENSAARGAIPSEHAIGREEEAILWRSLANIPEIYREPLILFYREHQSVGQMAAKLELTEDAAKQRLSRGRKLLQEEVHAFVESALERTAPGEAFSGAVLAALPLPAAVGAAVGLKGSAAAKSGILSACLVPFIGILAGIAAQWIMIGAAPERERAKRRAQLMISWGIALTLAFGGPVIVNASAIHFGWPDRAYFAAMTGFYWFLATLVTTWIIIVFRYTSAKKKEAAGSANAQQAAQRQRGFVSRIVPLLGTHLMMFWGVILLSWQAHDRLATAVIVGLMAAIAVTNYLIDTGETPSPASRAYIWQLASCGAATLAVVNLRSDVWVATSYGISVSEVPQHFPLWMVPALTAVLLIWAFAFLSITKPKPNPQY
jgi:RNA polymerase sigma factor (sigma-70 family)